jgi:SulP family sulfate permease
LEEEKAISYLFYKVLDPAICIYECEARAFIECQNLPKRSLPRVESPQPKGAADQIPEISPQELWQNLQNGPTLPVVIDVREPREYQRGHIPQAKLNPLPRLLSNLEALPSNGQKMIFVCCSGRRSQRTAQMLQSRGYTNVMILQGGMLAWENAGLLETVNMDASRDVTGMPTTGSTAQSNGNGF